jgi:Cysteine-rich CPCC
MPGRGEYDLCPVCWWEDEGVEPWEYSGPNAQTLVEAQQEFLRESRPYRRRPGKVRPPRRREARDPGWRPFELTDELIARVQGSNEEERRSWEAQERLVAQEIAADPEGPFKGYNAAVRSLSAETPGLSHREVRSRMRDLGREHDLALPNAYLELQSRMVKEKDFFRHHPVHAVWWMLRYARPGNYRRRWKEMRTGTFAFAG